MIARNGQLQREDMLVEDGKIVKIAPSIDVDADVIDVKGKTILPKLFDEHTHGSFGYDFNLATYDEMKKIIEFYKEQKIGTVYPTLLSDEDEVIERQLILLKKLAEEFPEVKGVHLEGPFLCRDYKGAMPEHLLQLPNIATLEHLQKVAGGLIKLMTISPELDGAPEFVAKAVAIGVKINLGHSGATYAQTMACIDAGATGFTHTFNAMKHMHQHELNIGGTAMLCDAYCEAICDGLHLCPQTVALLTKVKGLSKMVGVTDSIMAAGLSDGFYKLGVNDVVVKNGDARLVIGDTRAGSTLKAFDGLKNYAKFTNLPIEKAIIAWSENPAKKQGIFDITGSLDEGKLAEFFIYE